MFKNMVPIPLKVKILYLTSISIVIVYSLILLSEYGNLPEIIPTHMDFKGNIDGYGAKYHLWIAIGLNLLLNLICGLGILKTQHLNLHATVTEKNKERVHNEMRIFISILSIIVSLALSTMIFHNLKYSVLSFFAIMTPTVALPVVLAFTMGKKR